MVSDWLVAVACGLGAYLLGSVPTAYIVVRPGIGRDIRRLGSGNVGATNTFQQAGVLLGSLVMLADTEKGVLALLAPVWVEAPHWAMFVTTTLTLIGHNWPVFLRFRGGKGVAVIFGASLSLVPWLTLAALAPAILVIVKARNVTVGATLGMGLLNVLIIATGQSLDRIALCLFLTFLVSATYLVSIRHQLRSAAKSRRWRDLFLDTDI